LRADEVVNQSFLEALRAAADTPIAEVIRVGPPRLWWDGPNRCRTRWLVAARCPHCGDIHMEFLDGPDQDAPIEGYCDADKSRTYKVFAGPHVPLLCGRPRRDRQDACHAAVKHRGDACSHHAGTE
jgi:hypothetical protein